MQKDPLTWTPSDERVSYQQDIVSDMTKSLLQSRGIFDSKLLHSYSYVSNNPVNFDDPLGLYRIKKVGWWPESLDLFVPGYRNYGGPSRSGSGDPEDLMDAAFLKHDIGYQRGELRQSDLMLVRDLSSLPLNPKEWGKGVNPIYAKTYRVGALGIFSLRIAALKIGKGLSQSFTNAYKNILRKQ